jgi:3D-(3,5/4)-trihydroxycyclohexane-1,2-dione acylhydrolase (decyclizing)
MIVAGGGVLYSEATEALKSFVDQTGIPIGETHAGKGSLLFDHSLNMGAIGVTGTPAANEIAKDADLVIGIGTRYSDFTTQSKTGFQHPEVRFININVAEFDAFKQAALPLVGDARATLEELGAMLGGYAVASAYRSQAEERHASWNKEVDRVYAIRNKPLVSQGELIGAVNEKGDPGAIMVNAAGSMPGDLHKLWRSRHPKQYHMEYGYSCMGYEIAGGLGIKMADPDREVYVMVGDGSYLMLSADLTTAIQEGYKLTLVLVDNAGYKSIGSLSRSLGQCGFGTRYSFPENGRQASDEIGDDAQPLPIDLAANAESLGAYVIRCDTYDDLVAALQEARAESRTTVIYIQNDRYQDLPGYGSWWDVPVAEVSTMPGVQEARDAWESMRKNERDFV